MTDVCVVTPTYDRARLLPRVWRSIRDQKVNFSWIVVDDGSADETPAAVARLNDPRITYLRLPTNCGVNAARNAGALVADGRYLVFLDSDDELYPGALTRMLAVMEAADPTIGVCAFTCLSADTGQKLSRLTHRGILDEQQIVCHAALQQGGDAILVYRREVFDHFQLPADLCGCEQVFVYQVSQRYRYLMIDEPGSIVHRQGDNLSDAESLIRRSADIALSYERIVHNHAGVLMADPRACNRLLRKAMYRYGVARRRRETWRLYRDLMARGAHPVDRLLASGLFLVSITVSPRFERWRIGRAQRYATKARLP